MEDIVALVVIFGGGAFVLFAYSPIGKAIAERIRGQAHVVQSGADPGILDELDRVRGELAEIHERLDFAERMLANRPEQPALRKPEE